MARKRKNQQNAGGNNNQSGNNQSGNNQQSDNEGIPGNLLLRQVGRFVEDNSSLKFVQKIVTEHAKTELGKFSKRAQDEAERISPYPPEWITSKRTFEAQYNKVLKAYPQLRDKGKEIASGSGNGNNAEAGGSTSSPPSNTDAPATTDNSASVDSARATPETNTSASTRATPDTSQSNPSTARTTPESEAPSDYGRGSKQAQTQAPTQTQTQTQTPPQLGVITAAAAVTD